MSTTTRLTAADLMRRLTGDEALYDRLEIAARDALLSWNPGNHRDPVPCGWIGGQVRNALPLDLDEALGVVGMDDVEGDPTLEIGRAFDPRVDVDHLPPRNRDGAPLVECLTCDQSIYYVTDRGDVAGYCLACSERQETA